ITLVTTEEFKELQRIQKEVGAEMQLATIKDESGIDQSGMEYLAEKIRETHVHPHALNLLDYLHEMDQKLLLEKLLSQLIEKEQSNIGTQIGFDQQSVDDMMQEYESEQKETRKKNRSRKRR
ncbi:MAG: ATP-dependent helicase, partial [Campylobacterales bacterium]|nr:ATP-dependent helicase [Campylobacterales bacterium]